MGGGAGAYCGRGCACSCWGWAAGWAAEGRAARVGALAAWARAMRRRAVPGPGGGGLPAPGGIKSSIGTHNALAMSLAWFKGMGWRPSSYSLRILVDILARAASCPSVRPFFSRMLRSMFMDGVLLVEALCVSHSIYSIYATKLACSGLRSLASARQKLRIPINLRSPVT